MLDPATNQILLEFGFGEKDVDVDSIFGKIELQFHHRQSAQLRTHDDKPDVAAAPNIHSL